MGGSSCKSRTWTLMDGDKLPFWRTAMYSRCSGQGLSVQSLGMQLLLLSSGNIQMPNVRLQMSVAFAYKLPQIFFQQAIIQKRKKIINFIPSQQQVQQQKEPTAHPKQMNKNFRSSKNLKQVQIHSNIETKDDPAHLKLKIKALQQQVQLLKKTNLNIYIPLSQKEQAFKDKENKDEMIRKLRVQLLKEQQQSQGLKTTIKRLQKEKQVMKFNFENEIKEIKEQLQEQKNKNKQLEEQNQELQEQYQNEKEKRSQIQKQLIELRVQLRFMKQDLQLYKSRYQQSTKSLTQLKSLIAQVQFNSKIYKAHQTKITAIESSQLTQMRNCIFELQKQIQELLWKLANPKKQEKEKITLNCNTKNVAQEIVRLKRNIDLQLGVKGDDSVLKSFLDKYSETNSKFKELIQGCRAPQKLIDAIENNE